MYVNVICNNQIQMRELTLVLVYTLKLTNQFPIEHKILSIPELYYCLEGKALLPGM